MSDRKSSLPIRTESDVDSKVHIKIVDATDPDGVDKQVEVSEKLAHVRNFGEDPAGLKIAQLLSEKGETAIDGTYHATENTNPANTGIVTQERNAASSDTRQTMKPTSKRGSVDTDTVSLDISLHDESGNAYSQSNPLPVSMEESEGTEVQNYQTSSDIAADTSIDHDYTVTAGKIFVADDLWVSASGRLKVELQVETAPASGIFVTKKVGFSSVSNPNVDMPLKKKLKVAAGIKLRVKITNLEVLEAQDVYSTLEGVERDA